MKLIIEDDEGRKTVVPVVREEITIGRQDGNTIRLTERNVSRRHARLVKDNGSLLIEDLGSYNGVRVNGEKIAGPTKIKEGDLVEIGDYDLGIQGKLETPAAGAPAATPKQATMPPQAAKPAAAPKPAAAAPQPVSQPPPAAPPPQAAPPPPQPAPTPAAAAPAMPSAAAGGATAIIRVSDIMKMASAGGEARDLDRTEMPRLVGLAGPFRAKEFYLMRSEVKFGRTDENDIVVDHQSVSRQHAKFVLDAGAWKVMDNKSANGVRVNGDEYAVSNIKAGDTIELGHLKFRFCAPGEKFTPPPEKVDESAKPQGGMKPTTAELIAGASKAGPSPTKQAAAKAGPPMGLIAGIGGAVVVLLVIVVVMMMKGGKKEEDGEDNEPKKVSTGGKSGAAAGEAAAKKHDYRAAMEAFGSDAKGKKYESEAKGQEAYDEMKSAMDSGDADKAKTNYEKCNTDYSTAYWCQKASEQGDAVKASYAKKHNAAARAALAAGNADKCSAEVNLTLGFDSANTDAQSIQCQPKAAEPVEPKGPSAADRNAKAGKLAAGAIAKVRDKDFDGAIKMGQAALAEKPTDKSILGQAYMAVGYGYANKGDRANAAKWLEKYLPYCTAGCDAVRQFIGK